MHALVKLQCDYLCSPSLRHSIVVEGFQNCLKFQRHNHQTFQCLQQVFQCVLNDHQKSIVANHLKDQTKFTQTVVTHLRHSSKYTHMYTITRIWCHRCTQHAVIILKAIPLSIIQTNICETNFVQQPNTLYKISLTYI